MISYIDVLPVVLATLISGSLAYLWLRVPASEQTPDQSSATDICYLFDNGVLQHATEAADGFLALEPGFHEWSDLHAKVIDRFADFPLTPQTFGSGNVTLAANDGNAPRQVNIAWNSGLCRVRLLTDVQESKVPKTDEQALIHRLTTSLDFPIWHTDEDGKLLWSNETHQQLHAATDPTASQGDQPLFATEPALPSGRVFLRNAESGKKDWFELSQTEQDGVICHQAICINALVQAEETQRKFVQTLTKTFAQLSIGLAIFDRNSQLVLFNPALIDLTGLRAEFLSARPTVQTFFDKLRETRKMPEPKSYSNWRTAITEMIRAAHDGRYEETWSLDSGQTFNVKGRPHPDGATAFLIEDISAEVSLTRNFRAELELGQSMLDTLDDGIAVFSASGILTFSNSAYQDLWQVDHETSFADVTVHDAIQDWKRKCAPHLMWKEIEDFIRDFGDRRTWHMPMYLANGTQLNCIISPIVAGATLIRFDIVKNAVAQSDQINAIGVKLDQ